jgi:catechol 2,3-dioxygenase
MGTIHARLAHVGIYAHDKPKLEHFYTTVLGLLVTDSGTASSGMELTFLSANAGNHHQLVLVSGRPDTTGFNPINQISFLVDSLADLRVVDPEGNTVEAYLDTPFHVPQPHGKPLDLSKSDDEILQETEAACRTDPGFMRIETFQASLANRLAT